MKKSIKLLSVLLTFLLIFSASSVIALSATSGDYSYSILNNEAIITKADSLISGDITIPSNLGGYPVTSIGKSAFASCNRLKTVIVPYGVTSIEDAAFSGCTSLTSVAIPETVTHIGNSVFNNCSKLVSVTLPEGITFIGKNLFYGCSALKNVNIPNSVTSIGEYAFNSCELRSTITIPESVTSIGHAAFFSSGVLEKIYILNAECMIYDSSYTIDSDVTIYGCCNSTAQSYAKKYSRKFVIAKHFYVEEVTVPTCTEQGFTTYTCECGDSYVGDYVDAVHSLYEYESNGILIKKCNNCDYTEVPEVISQIERKSHLAYFLQYRETNCETYEQQIDNSVFFDGKVTKHNIDGLLLIAFWNRSNGKYYEMMPQESKYAPWACNIPLEDMNEMFFTAFGLENVDFSISQRYNTDNEMFYSPGGYGFEMPSFVTSFENGQYIIRWYDFINGTEEISENPCMTVTFNGEAKFTGVYFPDIPDEIPENDHIYTSAITTPTTHLTEGVLTYTCICGDSYTETIARTTEHIYESVVTAPTCTEQGFTTYTCECGDSYVDDFTEVVDHKDNDGDEFCDYCDEFLGSDEEEIKCSHICHKSGFMGFIWKIINFFQRLFGIKPVCECGMAHY